MIIRGSTGSPTVVRQCRWKLRCESTNRGSTGSPTVVDVIPGLTRNLWKVGVGLIQTLNQVQGDGLHCTVTDCVQGDGLRFEK